MVLVQKCDVCGDLYEKGIEASKRVKYKDDKVAIEIVVGTVNKRVTTWNDGHVCHKCLAKILRDIAKMLEENPEKVRR